MPGRVGLNCRGQPNMTCDQCQRPATVHFTAVRQGRPWEMHLCEPCCWAREGMAFPRTLSPAGTGRPVVAMFAGWSPHDSGSGRAGCGGGERA